MIGATRGFVGGFLLPLEALFLLLRHGGLKRYAALPLVVNTLVFILLFIGFIILLANWDLQVGDWEFWGPTGRWLSVFLDWTLDTLKWIVALPLLLLIFYLTFNTVGMIIAAPFNDILSGRVEQKLVGPRQATKVPLRTQAALLTQGMIDAILTLALQLLCMLLMLPFLAIPIVGFIPLLLVVAWFTGVGYLDIPLARHNVLGAHRKPVIQASRMELLGMGLCMELLFIIPFGALLMLPLGTTGGTILYTRTNVPEILRARGLGLPEAWDGDDPATGD